MELDSSGNLDVTGSGSFENSKIKLEDELIADSYMPSDLDTSINHRSVSLSRTNDNTYRTYIGIYHTGATSTNTVYGSRFDHVWMCDINERMRLSSSGDLDVTGSVTLDNSNFLINAPTTSGTKGLLFYRGGVERGRFDFDYSQSRARIQGDGDIKFYTNGENERMTIANNGDVTINNDLDVTGSGIFEGNLTTMQNLDAGSIACFGNANITGTVTASNIFDMVPSTIVGTSLAQTVTSSNAQVDLTAIKVDGSSTDYSISTASNNITFTNGDGSKIYEVTALVRYDLQSQSTSGATRSHGILSPRIGGTVDTDYEVWTYIREFQGGSQGTPSNSGTLTFQFQPTASQTLDFVVRGETDSGQTITDFDVDGIVVTVKRLA